MLLAALVAGGACAGGEAGTAPSGDRVLTAVPDEIKINPFDTGTVRVILTSGGVPIAGQAVTFTIIDDPKIPDVEAKGATLVDSSATTDGAGVATVDVRAGLETRFSIRATAGGAQTDLMVFVVAGSVGSIVVEPSFAPNSSAAARTTNMMTFFGDDQTCATLVVPAPPDKRLIPLPASGGMVRYDIISTSGVHAVFGRATDARSVTVAEGCIDVAGSSLIPGGVVEVQLLLADTLPDPVGSFAVTSTLTFVPPLAASAIIAAPWRDLGDCPLDPAQLFVDCAIDALSPETPGDPLDCKPSTVAGGEGALGDALAARRGKPILDGTGAATGCRGASDASGAPSLEAIAMGLFGSPTPPLVVALPAIGDDAAHLLDTFKLSTILDVVSAGRADEYVVTHTLDGAQFTSFTSRDAADVAIAPLVLPAVTAYTTASTTSDGRFVVANHGFSLRLGRVARAGFQATALEPRGISGDAGRLITALAALARSDDGSASGCAAFDRALCSAVGSATGCLATACPAGLSTLAAMLDSSFDAADGTGLDLYLAGSAPLIGRGDLAVQLGPIEGDPNAIASWSVDLRTAAGRAQTSAPFEGVRR